MPSTQRLTALPAHGHDGELPQALGSVAEFPVPGRVRLAFGDAGRELAGNAETSDNLASIPSGAHFTRLTANTGAPP
ncbi:hypothetical protein ABZ345_12475 [Lentzea sp. NPDC005914]|uniref:hypothetical protein n=1 Tax=Lentzea sp. NPDC005914 TaxID=3154572 RepID=UPI0033E0BF78